MNCTSREACELPLSSDSFVFSLCGRHLIIVPLMLLVCSCLSGNLVGQQVSDERFQERIDRLELMAEQCEANYYKILTWQSSYVIGDVTLWSSADLARLAPGVSAPGSEPWHKEDSGVVHLTYEAATDRFRTELIREKAYLTRNREGEHITVPLPIAVSQTSIYSQDGLFFLEPDLDYADLAEIPAMHGHIGRVAFREPPEKAAKQMHSNVIDPRSLFSYTRFFWDEIRMAAKLLKVAKQSEDESLRRLMDRSVTIQEYESGDESTVTIKIRLTQGGATDNKPTRTIRMRASPKHAFNFKSVGVSNESGKDVELVTWVYEELDGIWIPKHKSRSLLDGQDSSLIHTRFLIHQESRLNEPLDPDAFELKSLGLQDGERVVDRVERMGYVYRNGKLAEPVSFDALPDQRKKSEPNPEDSRSGWFTLLVWINIFVLAVLLARFSVSWHKKITSRTP